MCGCAWQHLLQECPEGGEQRASATFVLAGTAARVRAKTVRPAPQESARCLRTAACVVRVPTLRTMRLAVLLVQRGRLQLKRARLCVSLLLQASRPLRPLPRRRLVQLVRMKASERASIVLWGISQRRDQFNALNARLERLARHLPERVALHVPRQRLTPTRDSLRQERVSRFRRVSLLSRALLLPLSVPRHSIVTARRCLSLVCHSLTRKQARGRVMRRCGCLFLFPVPP